MADEATYFFKGGYPYFQGGPYNCEEMKKLYDLGYFRAETEITCRYQKMENGGIEQKEITKTLEEWRMRDGKMNLFLRVEADESKENILRHMATDVKEKEYEKAAEERRGAARERYLETMEMALSRINDPHFREKLLAVKKKNADDELEMEKRRQEWVKREFEARADRENKKRVEEKEREEENLKEEENARLNERLKEKQEALDEKKRRQEEEKRSVKSAWNMQENQPGSSGVAASEVASSPEFFTPTPPLLALSHPTPNPLTCTPLGVQHCLPFVHSHPPPQSQTEFIPGVIYQPIDFVPGMMHSPPRLVGVHGYPVPPPPSGMTPRLAGFVIMPTPLLDISLTGDVILNHSRRPQPPGVAKTLESYPLLPKPKEKPRRAL